MEFDLRQLDTSEMVSFKLRELYERYGYKKYKMRQFEAYSLYMENKTFLSSEQVITFTDLDGRLMALKPDVTLSIVKNVRTEHGTAEKVYYIENIYRPSRETGAFKEIDQMGLELIGKLDKYAISEVVILAMMSLREVSDNYILDINHMSFLNGLCDYIGLSDVYRSKIISIIGSRNSSELSAVCEEAELSNENTELLLKLTGLYGSFDSTQKLAESLIRNDDMSEAFESLKALNNTLASLGFKDKINIDYTSVNDIDYYNGIIFRGYVEGLSKSVLTGGQYDNLMRRFKRCSDAMGFALYLNDLSQIQSQKNDLDCDILITYESKVPVESVVRTVGKFIDEGYSVRAEKEKNGLKFKKHFVLKQDGLVEI